MLPYTDFSVLNESNTRGAHESMMKAQHHYAKQGYHQEMEHHAMAGGRHDKAKSHREAGISHYEAARHFDRAKSAYRNRVADKASQHWEAGQHWAKAAQESERKHALDESLPEYAGTSAQKTGAMQTQGYTKNPSRQKPKSGARGDGAYRDGNDENSQRVKTGDGSAM